MSQKPLKTSKSSMSHSSYFEASKSDFYAGGKKKRLAEWTTLKKTLWNLNLFSDKVLTWHLKCKQVVWQAGLRTKNSIPVFASCSKPSKSLNRNSENTTRSVSLPPSQSPFSTCANKLDFGRTMCTVPRQAECVWNTLAHAVLLSERQWGQDKLKMALICLLALQTDF